MNQINKYFIWMVVDDGLKDNTEKSIKSPINEAKIEIKYIKKINCTYFDSDDQFSEY